MKNKLFSIFTALAMVLGILVSPFTSAHADESFNGAPTETTVKIHKIIMSQEDFNTFTTNNPKGKAHDGSLIAPTDYATKIATSAEPVQGVAFKVYKYKGTDDDFKTLTPEFGIGTKAYDDDTTNYEVVGQVKLTDKDGIASFDLGEGNYVFVEDRDSSTTDKNITNAWAVPFKLSLPLTKPDGRTYFSKTDPLHVYPKNTEKDVQFDKNFAKDLLTKNPALDIKQLGNIDPALGAGANDYNNYLSEKGKISSRIGERIPYTARARFPKGTNITDITVDDSFDRGIAFDGYDETKKVRVVQQTLGQEESGQNGTEFEQTTDYDVVTYGNTGFRLTFTNKGKQKLQELIDGLGENEAAVDLAFQYYGVVTEDAVMDDPMNNNVTFNFNHTPPEYSSTPQEKPENSEIPVTKDWGEGNTVPEGKKVRYVLYQGEGENMKAVADVTFTDKQIATASEGDIKFEVTGDYTGKFTNLPAGKYSIKEFVDKYTPTYTNESDGVKVENKSNPNTITPEPPAVQTGGRKFVKADKDDGKRLNGAEFIIQHPTENKYLQLKDLANKKAEQTAYEKAEKAYTDAVNEAKTILAKDEATRTDDDKTKLATLQGEGEGSIKKLFEARNKAYAALKQQWTWDASKDNAFRFVTDESGRFEVKGLNYLDGYRLLEVKAPEGYALPTDGITEVSTFDVKEGSYTSAQNGVKYTPDETEEKNVTVNGTTGEAIRINNRLVTIPQTGGIGSLIFVVAGLAIMAGAYAAYRKSQARA